MTVHVECNHCHAWALTDNHAFPDEAAVCTSAADDPPGSPAGSCCADHESLEAHLAEARQTGDSRCRPVTITIMGVQAAAAAQRPPVAALGHEEPVPLAGVPQPPIGGQN